MSTVTKPVWDGREISKLSDVAFALRTLDLPIPTQDALTYLASGDEKERFKTILVKCVSGKADKSERTYLDGVVTCICNETIESLIKLGYKKVSFPELVRIGISSGIAFRNAIAAAMNPNDARNGVGLDYIKNAVDAATSANCSEAVGSKEDSAQPEQVSSSIPKPIESKPNSLKVVEPVRTDGSEFQSVHVYGKKFALCFNATMCKDKVHHTIIVDGAITTDRGIDWSGAVKVQLTPADLYQLYKVLIGWGGSASFVGRGKTNDKSFEIERQDGNFFAKVSQRSKGVRAVPITVEAVSLISLVFSQILKEFPPALRAHPDMVERMLYSTLMVKPAEIDEGSSK